MYCVNGESKLKRTQAIRPALRGVAAAIALVLSGQSQALRLSDIEVGSYLDQPLKARVQIRDATPEALSSLVTTLASREAFERAGIEPADALAGMTFDVDPSGRYLYIQTDRPVREPFMLFLVRGDWHDGSLTREFALLLDLPTAGTAARFDIPTVNPADQVKPFALPEGAGPTKTVASQAPQLPSAAEVAATAQATLKTTQAILVKSGDTLGRIARQYFDPALAPNLTAFTQALFEMNPKAFIRGDINLIRAGAELRLPALPDAPNAGPTLVADAAVDELPGVAMDTATAGGLRLVTETTVLDDGETEYLRQRIQALELQLAKLQAANASRTEVGNVIAEATGAALTPLPTEVSAAPAERPAAQVEPIQPVAPIAPVAAAIAAPAPVVAQQADIQPIAAITRVEPATASTDAVGTDAVSTDAVSTDSGTVKTFAEIASSTWQNLWVQIALAAAVIAGLLGLMAWRRRGPRFVPASSFAEDATISDSLDEPEAIIDEPVSTTHTPEPKPAAPVRPQYGTTEELLETCAVFVGYSRIDQALIALNEVIERDDNDTDPRVVARVHDLLARFRPDELDDFVATGRARWAANPQLLAALQTVAAPEPVHASQITPHSHSDDLGEIDMGLAPLPGEQRLDTIEFTLDLNDTRS